MIESIEFTVKGDYQSITMHREEGSNKVRMDFHYYNGMAMATFDFRDMKKAVEVLSGEDDEE